MTMTYDTQHDDRPPARGWSHLDTASVAAVAAMAALAYAVGAHGVTGPIPVHFGLSGEVDRTSSRDGLSGFITGLAATTAAVQLLFAWLQRDSRYNARASRVGYEARRILVLLLTGTLAVMAGALGFGVSPGGADGLLRVVTAVFAVAMLSAGALNGKVGRNPFVGVRTYWTLTSSLAWDKSNRLLGRLWFLGGVAALPLALIGPMPLSLQLTIGYVLVSSLLAVAESWRVWRRDPAAK